MQGIKDLSRKFDGYPSHQRFMITTIFIVAAYIISAVLLIFIPSLQNTFVKIILPVVSFIFGILWVRFGFKWFLSFILPIVLFTMFAFLRLDGLKSLILLIGHVLFSLAGGLLCRTVQKKN